MAKVVSAYATSHVLFSPKGVEEQAERVVAGMKELGRRAAAAQPDVLLMIVGDHMFNMDLSVQVPFTVGVADRWVGFGDLGLPARPFPGHRAFAEGLVRFAAERSFDLAKAEEVVPDHGVVLPLFFIEPWGSVPTVPLYVNINMDPAPSTARCRALAETIRVY
ncbi:MAG: AmmeMemoRadiSam system protein B, partial [Candidatus Binatia bacterium]